MMIGRNNRNENQSIPSTVITKENETPVLTDIIVDYSEYFQGISGCAVIYDESSNTYSFYDKKKCETEVSPLSTFKIVSALAGLENNVLENEISTMEYSGVKYPIDTWNSNLTLKEAFENEPMLVIHLAKNEIYARHGYIFTDKDLYNYFMGYIWYSPTCDGADFNDSVFNEYEKANLEILANLDIY